MTRPQFKQLNIPIIVIIASFSSAAGRQNTFSAVLPVRENNGSAYTFTWQNGRELASGTKGSTSFAYTYNADGLRTQKVVGNLVYTYYWQGGQLAAMTIGNTSGNISSTLKFYYDSNGIPFILDYNGTIYFYVTNLQGDVIGLATSEGMGGYYRYDAWGQIVTMDAASMPYYNALNANPLRYRGYIYDSETGFYYLQSRYYDPAVRRFISADGYVSTGTGPLGYNMYAYCNNNPVINVDINGCFPVVLLKIAIAVVVAVAVVTAVTAGINHAINACNVNHIEDELEDSYTKEEAQKAISEINENLVVNFDNDEVIIKDSSKIKSRYDRQKISMIIDRTVGMSREADNMSSEWLLHNIFYSLNIMRANADPANLEYDQDSRKIIRWTTNILEFLGWE